MASPPNLTRWKASGKRTTFRGLPIFYQSTRRERDERPWLVCVHGFPTSSWDFAPMWAELDEQFALVASDLIGLGYSAKPECPLTIALQADAIESLLSQLGVGEAHLYAHDLGDTVAQELLARNLDGSGRICFKSCVFLNGGLFPETHQPRFIQKLLLSPLGGAVAKLTSEKRFRASMKEIFGPHTPPSPEFLDGAWEQLVADSGRKALPRLITYMEERRVYRERWIEPLVQSRIPLRFINGALDPVSGRHAADRYRELVPDADVVMLDDLGHYPHVEDPSRVLSALREFWLKVSAFSG
ncbi:MAG: alpha/beta fold hydrolase [Polyangiaceae bacterium]